MALNKSEALQLTQLIAIVSQLAAHNNTPVLDEYSDTLMSILNRAISGSGSNTVVVTSVDDFPDPIGEVITLDEDVNYMIEGAVNIGANRIVTNGGNLIGNTQNTDSLIYTGSGVMLTVTNHHLELKNLTMICSSGTFMDFNGTVTENLVMTLSTVICSSIGDVEGVNIMGFQRSVLVCSMAGITFTGTSNLVNMDRIAFSGLSGSGTYIQYNTSSLTSSALSTVSVTVNAGETFVSGLANTANFSDAFQIVECIVSGAGTYLNGITTFDSKANFRENFGIENSHAHAHAYIADGAEATTTIGVGSGDTGNPILVTGTYTVVVSDRTTTSVAGRTTYTGPGRKTFHTSIIFKGAPSSGSNKTYNFYIAVNGVVNVASRSQILASAGQPINGHCQSDIDLSTGEYIELYVENITDTQDVIVSAVNQLMTD